MKKPVYLGLSILEISNLTGKCWFPGLSEDDPLQRKAAYFSNESYNSYRNTEGSTKFHITKLILS